MVYNQRTVKAKDVPKEMRLPHIDSGYRLLYQPWRYYMKSLFHLHNETINIWSHLIGCIATVYQIYTYYGIYKQSNSDLRWTVVVFGICCFTTLFNSATAHLLHSKSAYVNYIVFMFDYIGVVSWGFGTSLLAVYGVSDPDMYKWLGPDFTVMQLIWTYISYISICLSKLWFGHDLANMKRKLMIVSCILAQAVTNISPWFPRYTKCFYSDECDLSSLNHITVTCISFIIMTLTFVLHQPETCCPHKFDIFGQSHQIFHVIVIITQILQFRALYVDFKSNVNTHCHPDFYRILGYIFILYIACLSTIFVSRGRVKWTIEHNKRRD